MSAAAELEMDDVDYHALAWSKFVREIDEDFPLGPIERIRGIPVTRVLLRSIEWAAWRNGRTWDVMTATPPRRKREPDLLKRLARKRVRPIVTGGEGSVLW